MTITTLDQVIAGSRSPAPIQKVFFAPGATGRMVSSFLLSGMPPAGTVNTTPAGGTFVGGPAVANLVPGQIFRLDPPNPKKAYLAKAVSMIINGGSGTNGMLFVCDRLWDNGGLSTTITTSQTVNSVAWPARDEAGGTAGAGVLIGLEISVATGAGTPTVTLTYTNSAGTGSRTATLRDASYASAAVGAFFRFSLQSGDRGVQSIQSVQLSATWTSGTMNLVAYRVLGALAQPSANGTLAGTQSGLLGGIDPITGGFQRVFNGACPFLLLHSNNIQASTAAFYQETWG